LTPSSTGHYSAEMAAMKPGAAGLCPVAIIQAGFFLNNVISNAASTTFVEVIKWLKPPRKRRS
jgi:hypothetical protein